MITIKEFEWVWNQPNHRYIDDEYIVQATNQVINYGYKITCAKALSLLDKKTLQILNEVKI